MRWVLVLLLVNCACRAAGQEIVLPLDQGWWARQEGSATWFPAQVPGVVHTDLLRNGLIPDPYVDMNADSVQWIERTGWVYELDIVLDGTMLGHEHADLVFKGLDTFADVYLNDSLLGRTDNMFRTWEWDVKSRLRAGNNRLRVAFRSPVAEGMRLRQAQELDLPHDNDPSGASPFVRKAAYHFGWDFAPRLVTSGIWRPVELRFWDDARIESVSVRSVSGPSAFHFNVQLAGNARPDHRIRVFLDDVQVAEEPCRARTVELACPVASPKLWWPHGHGEQALYRYRVELVAKGQVIGTASGRAGLRTVELVQDPDSVGRNFHFKVNGRPLFAQGCNIVPPDMFLPRAGDEGWVRLVADMREAEMNMVRVWAGGVYPPEAFFDACDTAGIMVWQDVMLANLPSFQAENLCTLEAEVREQALRIGNHPSLALWCGNNELAVAWRYWGWQERYGLSAGDQLRIESGYEALFEGGIPEWIRSGPEVPYVHTSPLSNWGSEAGLRSGNLHYWGVWHADSTFASFANNVGRFVSEYGFQSYPDSSTLARYLSPEHCRLGDPVLVARQRSYRTDRPIHRAIANEGLPVPNGLEAWCATTQHVQAIAYERAIAAHVGAAPWCMGTLLWQLNDVWPGPSWSIIDHDGVRKQAYERVKQAYRANLLRTSGRP